VITKINRAINVIKEINRIGPAHETGSALVREGGTYLPATNEYEYNFCWRPFSRDFNNNVPDFL